VFIYSSCGKWVFPPLLWSFPPTAAFTSFPVPGCWACAAAPGFSGRLVYLQFCEGLPLPPLWHSGRPALFASVFFLLLSITQVFFLFSRGGGQSVQRAMLIWPKIVCGSTASCFTHLVVCIFPSHLGTGVWRWCWRPPGFSI
jgi:hypothetical protein